MPSVFILELFFQFFFFSFNFFHSILSILFFILFLICFIIMLHITQYRYSHTILFLLHIPKNMKEFLMERTDILLFDSCITFFMHRMILYFIPNSNWDNGLLVDNVKWNKHRSIFFFSFVCCFRFVHLSLIHTAQLYTHFPSK